MLVLVYLGQFTPQKQCIPINCAMYNDVKWNTAHCQHGVQVFLCETVYVHVRRVILPEEFCESYNVSKDPCLRALLTHTEAAL